MSEREVALAVVGAGPAGLSAAAQAAELGVETVVLDMYSRPGGQFFKLPEFTITGDGHIARQGLALIDSAKRAGATIWSNVEVWGLYDESPLLLGLSNAEVQRLKAHKVIVAAGAYDLPVPFPGWTLPGVMGVGGALAMLKNQRLIAGRRLVMSGTGPLQLAAAAYLAVAGAHIEAVLELRQFSSLLGGWHYAGAALGQQERMAEGWGYLRALQSRGVPIRMGRAVVRAEGREEVERAVVAKVDKNGRPLPGTEETLEVDTICQGYGLIPSAQLSRQIDCKHEFHPELHLHLPVRDRWLQTSTPGLFVVGDAAGIVGKEGAMLEGRLAALEAARQLGRLDESRGLERARPLQSALDKERRFAHVLNGFFGPLPGLWELAQDDTIVCRCENVTLAQVKQAVADGCDSFPAVKNHSRVSMGRCQGRMCTMSVARAISRELGCELEQASRYSARPPAFPVPLEELLKDTNYSEDNR